MKKITLFNRTVGYLYMEKWIEIGDLVDVGLGEFLKYG